jgi:hypothetical protein
VLSPKKHGVAWMLAWGHAVDSWMYGLQQCSCRGSGPSGAHGLGGALESLRVCKSSVGNILWNALALEPWFI